MKKTYIAIAAAVCAAGALTMPCHAAGKPIVEIGTVSITMEELAAEDYQIVVPVTITGSGGWKEIAHVANYDVEEMTIVECVSGVAIWDALAEGIQAYYVPVENNEAGIMCGAGSVMPNTSSAEPEYAGDGVLVNMTFKINENAEDGDVYRITTADESNGLPMSITTKEDGKITPEFLGGAVIIGDDAYAQEVIEEMKQEGEDTDRKEKSDAFGKKVSAFFAGAEGKLTIAGVVIVLIGAAACVVTKFRKKK